MPSLLTLCVYEKVDSRPTHSYFCFHFHLGDLKFSQFHAVFWKIWQKLMLAPTGRLAPPPTGNPWSSTVLVFSFNRKQKNLTPFFGILVVIRPFVHFIYFYFSKTLPKAQETHFSLHEIRLPEWPDKAVPESRKWIWLWLATTDCHTLAALCFNQASQCANHRARARHGN